MAGRKAYWVYSPRSKKIAALSQFDKDRITEYFKPLIEKFKARYILKDPDRQYGYCVDIYSKWHQSFFYLCEKRKYEHSNRLYDEAEIKFVRLKHVGKEKFDFSYFRHTGQWHIVAQDITLDECKSMIMSNPLFQPIE